MQAMLDEAESNVQTWQEKHRDVVAELRMVTDKSRQHEVLAEDYRNDLESTWAQLEDEKRNNGTLKEQVQKLKGQLATCSADLEQLKSLALAGSRSQSELESKIMSQATERRDAQATIQRLNDTIHQRTEMHEKSMHELATHRQSSKGWMLRGTGFRCCYCPECRGFFIAKQCNQLVDCLCTILDSAGMFAGRTGREG